MPCDRCSTLLGATVRAAVRFILALFLLSYPAMGQPFDPVADSSAQVRCGHARFTILTDRLIRMEWSPAGEFEDRASFAFVNRRLPVPRFSVDPASSGRSVVITTAALKLTYAENPADAGEAGRFDRAGSLKVEFTLNGKPVTWTPESKPTGNLGGTTRTLDGVDGSCNLELGLISRDGWSLVDDSKRLLLDPLAAGGNANAIPWATPRKDPAAMDWYFFGYGHDYAGALADFTKVAGKIPLPPKYVFGAWWSRYWAYSDTELKDIVRQFDDHGVPLDVLVIDMDWHLDGWTGYTWNKRYFPDAPGFLKWVHENGLHTTLNLHPADGVGKHEAMFAQFKAAMGITERTCYRVPFDCTDRKFVDNYFKLLHHPQEEAGVDFWWMDWQQGMNTKIEGLDPLYWLNYLHWVDMERRAPGGPDATPGAPDKRPLIFSRWGGLGNHRYEIGFSGDTYNTWKSLSFQPYFTATAANVGYGYWSHDIGGHQPGPVPPEMYARWIQYGIFSPVLRTHCSKRLDAERRIWAFPPETFEVCRDAFILRYQLIPYTYSACRQAYDTGVSLCRPMYYGWPERDEAYNHPNQYMYGDDLLLAPVVGPANETSGVASVDAWLPPNESGWVEWCSGKAYDGKGHSTRASYALREIPIFVRAGAVIPMQPKVMRTSAAPADHLILNFFGAEAPRGGGTVYEDDGISAGYQNNQCARTVISHELKNGVRDIIIRGIAGNFPGMAKERSYELRLHGELPPEAVTVAGAALPKIAADAGKPGWWFDQASLTTIIRTAKLDTKKDALVSITRSKVSAAPLAAGLLGQLAVADDIAALLGDKTPATIREFAALRSRIAADPADAMKRAEAAQAAWWELVKAINAAQLSEELKARALGRILGLSAEVSLRGGADGASVVAEADVGFAPRFTQAHGIGVGVDFASSDGWRIAESKGTTPAAAGTSLTLALGQLHRATATLTPVSGPAQGELHTRISIRENGGGFGLTSRQSFCPSINAWWLLGPFDSPDDDKIQKEFIPEGRPIDLAATHTGRKGKKLTWTKWTRPLTPSDDPRREFFVDFIKAFGGQHDDAAAYALCYLDAPSETRARLALGSDDGAAAWLNGVEVFRKYLQRGYSPKDDLIDVVLKKGRNELLVKVGQAQGAWGFCVHVEDANGRAIEGVRAVV